MKYLLVEQYLIYTDNSFKEKSRTYKIHSNISNPLRNSLVCKVNLLNLNFKLYIQACECVCVQNLRYNNNPRLLSTFSHI